VGKTRKHVQTGEFDQGKQYHQPVELKCTNRK
jgi:hypothetical protein